MLAPAEEAVEEREEVGEEGGVVVVAAAAEPAAEDAETGVCALLQREDGGGRGGREEGAPSCGGEVTPGRGWSEEEQTDRQQVWKQTHTCVTRPGTPRPTSPTSAPAPSGRDRCGLDVRMTPSVSHSSDCLRRRSQRPIPSLPCSSSMRRS